MAFKGGGGAGGGGGIVGFGTPSAQVDVGDAVSDGVADLAARSDHQHAVPGPGAPLAVQAVNATGAETTPARADHRHAHTVAAHRAGGHADLSGDYGPVNGPAVAVAAHEAAADPHVGYVTDAGLTAHGSAVDPHAVYVLESLIDAKGDLLAGTGADALGRLAAGADGQFLVADLANLNGLGLKWAPGPAGGATDHGALTGLADNDHPQYALAAGGGRVASGSYVGNAAAGTWAARAIALPFVPRLVWVESEGDPNYVAHVWRSTGAGGTRGLRFAPTGGGTVESVSNRCPILSALASFTVSTDTAITTFRQLNENFLNYTYVAIG